MEVQQKILWAVSVIGMCPLSTLQLVGCKVLGLPVAKTSTANTIREAVKDLIELKFLNVKSVNAYFEAKKEKADEAVHSMNCTDKDHVDMFRFSEASKIFDSGSFGENEANNEPIVSPLMRSKTEGFARPSVNGVAEGKTKRMSSPAPQNKSNITNRISLLKKDENPKGIASNTKGSSTALNKHTSGRNPSFKKNREVSLLQLDDNDSILEFVSVDTLDVCYNMILPSERRTLHKSCYEVLKSTQAAKNDELYDTLGHHAMRADLYEEAIGFEDAKYQAYCDGDYYLVATCLRSCITIGRTHLDTINEIQIPYWLLELSICSYITEGAEDIDVKSLAECIYRFKKMMKKLETRGVLSKWKMRWIRLKASLAVRFGVNMLKAAYGKGDILKIMSVRSSRRRKSSVYPSSDDPHTAKVRSSHADRYQNACFGFFQSTRVSEIVQKKSVLEKLSMRHEKQTSKIERKYMLQALSMKLPGPEMFRGNKRGISKWGDPPCSRNKAR